MTIAQLIAKRELQHDACFLLWVLQSRVMQLAPVPVDITDNAGWDKFILSAQLVRDIEQIRREVMR